MTTFWSFLPTTNHDRAVILARDCAGEVLDAYAPSAFYLSARCSGVRPFIVINRTLGFRYCRNGPCSLAPATLGRQNPPPVSVFSNRVTTIFLARFSRHRSFSIFIGPLLNKFIIQIKNLLTLAWSMPSFAGLGVRWTATSPRCHKNQFWSEDFYGGILQFSA